MAYEALDFYDIDSLLTEEERMVRDMVRKKEFCRILRMRAEMGFSQTSGGLRLERWASLGLL